MISIGNGEACPFCKGKNKFINEPDNNFLKHIMAKHPKEANEALFSRRGVGL